MIRTEFTGAPCWLDLGAPDVPAAAAFYSAVLGWEFQSLGPEMGDFGFFRVEGKTVAGLGKLTEEGARSAWMIYFRTQDADVTTEAVRRAGGTVRVPPTDADGEGRMAQYTDPQGGQFAVWQPGTMLGIEAVDRPGALNWTELYTTDAEAAKEFYGGVFGWQTDAMPMDEETYWLVTPAGGGQESMQGGIMQLAPEDLGLNGGKPYWHPVFQVADCDAAVASVTGNGGSVQMGPVDAEGVGRLAVCVDPAGADFVVLTPAEG
ncbi:VOC family protein [Allostreptomyces psammosilenae]|uniref:VOC domain-containing protein n=1 Tax=Allostreptomyces psammosilenae TaxID=1892865 RepID=A0A852ZZC9_9ACTN|nr:VOC family protein [Allostreptomyces psammosilenae]NYI03478.1 hypothetical protein [Allostreptomyces psammosilenae]